MAATKLSAKDYADMQQLWTAAGLENKPGGRDSESAITAQLDSGIVAAFGVYNDNGLLIGIALASHDTRKGWINRLAVHPDYQRHGIGAQLLQACEQHFQQLGIQIMAALVTSDNVGSLALFQSEGYHLHHDIVYLSKRADDEV